MQIVQIDYNRFRSANKASLDKCSQFNVLIGQNNSGKSNLLKGITSFFSHLDPNSLVSFASKDRTQDLNIFKGEESNDASLTITFALSGSEQDNLIADLSKEAPQLRNALDDFEPGLLLRVTQRITKDPAMFYVSEIALVSPTTFSEKVILEVGTSSSIELHERAKISQYVLNEIGQITGVRDDLIESERAGIPIEERGYVRRSIMRRFPAKDESLRTELLEIVNEKLPLHAIQASLTDLIAQRQELLDQQKAQPLSHTLSTFAGQAISLPQYAINILAQIKSIKIMYLDETRKPVGEEEARRLLTLKMRRGGSIELQAIQTTVSGLLGVQIDAFESAQGNESSRRSLAEMDVDNFLVQANGSGIREALRLMLDVQFENPDILLLEEPEVHLHPALEHNLLQYLKQQSRQRQVFLTTHSTNFLDTAEDSNVYLVRKNEVSTVQRMTLDDLEEEIPRELGIRLSSVFMFDRLVFVEGPSDESVLRELAFKLDINLAQHNVGFIQMGGARGFAQYVNAAVIDTLSKRQVKLFFIIDKDERAEAEIAKMANACSNKAQLHVLKKRELENYLFLPESIANVITRKSSGKITPDIDEIRSLIEDAAEALRGRTIARHALQLGCRSLLFDRSSMSETTDGDFVSVATEALDRMQSDLDTMRQTLDDVKARTVADIDQKWDHNKLNLIPGADLLDFVFQKYGVRYRKDRDAVSLVRPLEAHDIDPELATLLKSIVE